MKTKKRTKYNIKRDNLMCEKYRQYAAQRLENKYILQLLSEEFKISTVRIAVIVKPRQIKRALQYE